MTNKYKDIKIPKSWREVTISQYQELTKVSEESLKEDFASTIILLSIFTGLHESEIEQIELSIVQKWNMQLANLFDKGKCEDLYEKIWRQGKHKRSYEINGTQYILWDNPEKMQSVQFTNQNDIVISGDDISLLHTKMACFLIPKGHTYTDKVEASDVNYTYLWEKSQIEIKEHFNIADTLAICFFFLNMYTSLSKGFLYSSRMMIKRELIKNKKLSPQQKEKLKKTLLDLKKNGGGCITAKKLFRQDIN